MKQKKADSDMGDKRARGGQKKMGREQTESRQCLDHRSLAKRDGIRNDGLPLGERVTRGYEPLSREARYEDRHEMKKSFYVCGVHPVEESLQTLPQRELCRAKLFVAQSRDDKSLKTIFELCEEKSIEVEAVDMREITRRSGEARHQGVLLELPEFQYSELDEVLDSLSEHPLIVVLDQIQDPHNLGAIIRSAAAFGADAVVIARDRAAQMNATSIKTSAGQAYRIPICRVSNIAQTLRELKSHDFVVIGADINGTSAQDVDFRRAVALVMGSESTGMRRLTRTLCDETVRIAQNPNVESLNVSVAAAIFMYTAQRRRNLAWTKGE